MAQETEIVSILPIKTTSNRILNPLLFVVGWLLFGSICDI